MAMNYSPDYVSFILIDYKGGGLAGAFENKLTGVSLPHLAGTITNLDKAEMDRTLVSIESESKRRQAKFNEARDKLGESTIDIYKYQKFYKEGRLEEPIPHLFIICDEFAELKAQQPDFMDNLISVARIGRSLGVHLILATQKPSGVVNDQIWSNTKFRVCLKVASEADSNEMLKKPDAAHIKQAGRYYLQVGMDEIFELGQSGYCGAKYYPSNKIIKEPDKSIVFINEYGVAIKRIKASSRNKKEAKGEQIQAVMQNIIQASKIMKKKSKRLWLENIPEKIYIEDIEKKYNFIPSKDNKEIIVGEYDAPEQQEQGIVKYDLLTDGNTIIYGNDGEENENLLSVIIYSLSKHYTPNEVNMYIMDYGSEFSRKFLQLPHIGGAVYASEDDKYTNLLKLITNETNKRKRLFADYGGSFKNYLRNSKHELPVKLIIINNFDSLQENNSNVYEELLDITRDSERYGIVYIITANTTGSIRSKMVQNFNNIYAFKLKDKYDYNFLFGIKSKTTPRDIFGRGIFKNVDKLNEFQTLSITDDEKLNDYIQNFIELQKQQNGSSKVDKIPEIPRIIRYEDVKEEEITLSNVPIGYIKATVEIAKYDFKQYQGTFILSNKLLNTKIFVKSLIKELLLIKNSKIIIFDYLKQLEFEQTQLPQYYYTENIETTLKGITEYIESLQNKNINEEGIILFNGIDKLIGNINDKKIIESFFKTIKLYEKYKVIIVEEINKIKSYISEQWYKDLFSKNDGVWVGKGIGDQTVIKLSTFKRYLSENYKNNYGFMVVDSEEMLCQLIDFETKEDDLNE